MRIGKKSPLKHRDTGTPHDNLSNEEHSEWHTPFEEEVTEEERLLNLRKKEFVEKISKKIIESLISKDLIIWESSPDKLELIINNIIIIKKYNVFFFYITNVYIYVHK